MGMDVYGVQPISEKGKYFRNNVWWWRPLWDYTYLVARSVLSEKDYENGHYNDGHEIPKDKAETVAAILRRQIEIGETQKYAEAHQARLAASPLMECELCHGTGKRTDAVAEANPHLKERCNGCEGKGKRAQSETFYPFSTENVREFAEFLEQSGGLRIS